MYYYFIIFVVNMKIILIIFFQPKMEKPYIVSKNNTGADCGPDHELLLQNSAFWIVKRLSEQF